MAGINALIARLERVSSGEVYGRIGLRISDACHAQAIAGFRGERDPYGVRWAPRKDARGSWPLLDRTGSGIDSLTARYATGMVTMRISGYFRFHQFGTAAMVSRKVFPDATRGLGTWAQPIQRAATDAVRELMR